MAASRSRLAGWLGLSAIVIVLDQLAKAWVVRHLQLHDALAVNSFFTLVRAHNTGAAFSFLAEGGGWQRWLFTGLGIAASALMAWLIARHGAQKLFAFAIAMILGGAIGNVIDRVVHGYVVDFLQFRFAFLEPIFHGGYFPAFNLADSAITLGAICLVLDELRRVRRSG